MNKDQIQKEALDKISNLQKSGIAVSMGIGKTRIGIMHMKKYMLPDSRILVVVPKNKIKNSWITELDITNNNDLLDNIEFVTYLSLNKKDSLIYDLVYLDECHNLLFSHESFLRNSNAVILGLTGTPPKHKTSEKGVMVSKYCPIVYNFSLDEATNSNILNNYEIILHPLRLSTTKNFLKKKKDGSTWYTSEADDYIYLTSKVDSSFSMKEKKFFSILRMKALMDYQTKEKYVIKLLDNISDKCIIFANTQNQADKLCKYSYHSNNPKSEENLELFSSGRINRLSCVLQLNEGITIHDLKQAIILHVYGNERKFAQRLGRLLRLTPDQKAICHILYYENTVDEVWLKAALSEFDQSKIKTIEYEII